MVAASAFGSRRRCRRRSAVDGLAGEGEEHLVERRAAQADVVDGDAALVEQAHDGRPAGRRRRRPATETRWVSSSTRGGSAPTRSSIRRPRRGRRAAAGRTSIDVAPGPGLELVRRAGGDDAAVVDDHDVVGQLVGLLEVLRGEQHVGAVGDEAADRLPQLDPAARVEPGGRLVEQQQRGRADQAGAEVEPAAHAARVGRAPAGRRRRSRPSRSSTVAAGGLGAARGRGRTAGRPSRGSPGRSSPARPTAYWPARPMTWRTCFGSATASMPATRSVPAVGPQQRGDRADEGRLAGAVRAEHGGDLAGLGDEVEPVEGADVAEPLGEAWASMIGGMVHEPRRVNRPPGSSFTARPVRRAHSHRSANVVRLATCSTASVKFGIFYEHQIGRPWERRHRAPPDPGRARPGRARRPARHPVRVGGRAPLPRGVQPLVGARGVPRRLQPAHAAHPARARDHPHRPAVQPPGPHRRADRDARPGLRTAGSSSAAASRRSEAELGGFGIDSAAQARRVARGARDRGPLHGRDAVHRRRRRVRHDAAPQRRAQAGAEAAPAAVGRLQPARDDPARGAEGHRRARRSRSSTRGGAQLGAPTTSGR